MAETPWTKGPWRVEQDTTLVWGHCSYDDSGAVDCLGIPVAEVQTGAGRYWGRAFNDGEISANARLIAAAPMLYEALESFIAAWDGKNVEMNSPEIGGHDDIPPHPWHEEWLFHARAALARARGDE